MNHRNIFRTLVITTNLAYVLSAFIFVYLDNQQLEAAYAALPQGSDFESYLSDTLLGIIVLAGIVAIWFASVAGLLLFKNWGRTCTVLGFLVGLPWIALMGPTIEFGLESALNEFLAVCNGIIIASMYLPPISAEFNKDLKQGNSVRNSL
jgi:hypothetical protein